MVVDLDENYNGVDLSDNDVGNIVDVDVDVDVDIDVDVDVDVDEDEDEEDEEGGSLGTCHLNGLALAWECTVQPARGKILFLQILTSATRRFFFIIVILIIVKHDRCSHKKTDVALSPRCYKWMGLGWVWMDLWAG